MKSQREFPRLVISPKGTRWVEQGHPWIYEAEVVSGGEDAENGVLEVAEKLCDKVAIIKSGRLIASGSMEEVKGDSSLEDVFLELEGDGNA